MASVLRIKRRTSGNAGAPSTLANAELAFNEIDSTLYYGVGTGGTGGAATTVIPIAGPGGFVDKTSAQTIAGIKTFSISPVLPTPATTDSSTNGATTAFVGAYVTSLKGAASGLCPLDANQLVPIANLPASVKGAMNYAGSWNANTNSPALSSGTGTKGNVYKVTTAGTTTLDGISQWNVGDQAVFNGTVWDKWDGVATEVLSVNGSVGAVVLTTDNINQGSTNLYFTAAATLAVLLAGLSTSTASVISTSDSILVGMGKLQAQVTARLVAANNLSDIATPATARTNLGLGTMAVQNASAVAITGGTIDAITFDGGTF